MEFIIASLDPGPSAGAGPLRARRRPAAAQAEIDRADARTTRTSRATSSSAWPRASARIAAAFYPRDVIVRLSDFKTNEYAGLLGGEPFEPKEENPMIGFRGALRYYDPRYREGFLLECRAMRKVREEMGLTNVKLMVPFCRTVEEGRAGPGGDGRGTG